MHCMALILLWVAADTRQRTACLLHHTVSLQLLCLGASLLLFQGKPPGLFCVVCFCLFVSNSQANHYTWTYAYYMFV